MLRGINFCLNKNIYSHAKISQYFINKRQNINYCILLTVREICIMGYVYIYISMLATQDHNHCKDHLCVCYHWTPYCSAPRHHMADPDSHLTLWGCPGCVVSPGVDRHHTGGETARSRRRSCHGAGRAPLCVGIPSTPGPSACYPKKGQVTIIKEIQRRNKMFNHSGQISYHSGQVSVTTATVEGDS